MKYIFRKEKMMQRLKAEGRENEIDSESREIMDSIDGGIVEKNRFKALVYDIEEGFIRTEKYGDLPVNLNDCDKEY